MSLVLESGAYYAQTILLEELYSDGNIPFVCSGIDHNMVQIYSVVQSGSGGTLATGEATALKTLLQERGYANVEAIHYQGARALMVDTPAYFSSLGFSSKTAE